MSSVSRRRRARVPVWLAAAVAAASLAGSARSGARADAAQPASHQVWADEFEGSGPPDPRSWTFERGFVRNREAQWYQEANAFRRDGLLVIEARRERVPNPDHVAGSDDWRTARTHAEYTSASVTTKGLHAWQYGRFEMRARIDTRDGLWPAFWTLGVEGEWPDNGEIDVMEYYRGLLLANVAWGSGRRWTPTWDSTRVPLLSFGRDWADAFHVWWLDGSRDRIDPHVDDRLMNVTALAAIPAGPRGPAHPFRQPHYLLLNLAIGGENGGDPAKTAFPARFEVDWVRVSQPAASRASADGGASGNRAIVARVLQGRDEGFSAGAHDSSGASD
jgi:beta-glucanase (GH16 family)